MVAKVHPPRLPRPYARPMIDLGSIAASVADCSFDRRCPPGRTATGGWCPANAETPARGRGLESMMRTLYCMVRPAPYATKQSGHWGRSAVRRTRNAIPYGFCRHMGGMATNPLNDPVPDSRTKSAVSANSIGHGEDLPALHTTVPFTGLFSGNAPIAEDVIVFAYARPSN